jgi:hypothetical protein
MALVDGTGRITVDMPGIGAESGFRTRGKSSLKVQSTWSHEIRYKLSPNSSKKTKPRRIDMKAVSKLSKSIVFTAILACLMLAAAGSAAAATDPITRKLTVTNFTGECCMSFGESVSIAEGATIKPVIVIWSFDFAEGVQDEYFVGLSVNGGACETLSWGARALFPYATDNFSSTTFQWVILPTDGVLVKGTNTFEVCGGGKNSSSDLIAIGDNTLTVALGK